MKTKKTEIWTQSRVSDDMTDTKLCTDNVEDRDNEKMHTQRQHNKMKEDRWGGNDSKRR